MAAMAPSTIQTKQPYPVIDPRMPVTIPYEAHVKQQLFLLLDCQEAFYGGAARGGKSVALLMAALQYVDVPNYAALILRRTFPQLSIEGGLIPMSHQWLTAKPYGVQPEGNGRFHRELPLRLGILITITMCTSTEVRRSSSLALTS